MKDLSSWVLSTFSVFSTICSIVINYIGNSDGFGVEKVLFIGENGSRVGVATSADVRVGNSVSDLLSGDYDMDMSPIWDVPYSIIFLCILCRVLLVS